MKITFLGTSHGYAEKGRFTSSALIESGGKYYILDAGAPIEYLLVNGEKDYDKIKAVFITHMHNDHVGSLSSIVEPMLRYRYNNKATCFFPSNEGSVAFSDWLYALGVREEDLKKTVKIGDEERTVVSGIAHAYSPEFLIGKKLLMVTNLKPCKLCGIMSEGMICCAENDEGKLAFLSPETDIEDGSQVF